MKKTSKKVFLWVVIFVCVISCAFILFAHSFGADINLVKHQDIQLNGFTLKFYGDIQSVHVLKVYEGSIRRATLRLEVDKEILKQANTYTPYFDDLNGDGHPDLLVPHSADEKYTFRYAAFIWDNKISMFTPADAMSEIANISVDLDNGKITSKTFEHKIIVEEQPNIPEIYEESEKYAEYGFIDGTCVTYKELTLTYYSETDIYSFLIHEYNEETKELEYVDEQWLSKDELNEIDFP